MFVNLLITFFVFYGPGGCFEWSNLNNVTAGNLKLSAIIPDDVSNEVVDCCGVSQSVDIPVCGHPTLERCMGFIFTTYLPIFVAQHRFLNMFLKSYFSDQILWTLNTNHVKCFFQPKFPFELSISKIFQTNFQPTCHRTRVWTSCATSAIVDGSSHLTESDIRQGQTPGRQMDWLGTGCWI